MSDRAGARQITSCQIAQVRARLQFACCFSTYLRVFTYLQAHGVPAKFPGSGGAVVGLCIDDEAAMRAMQHDLERNGCVFTRLVASPPIA